MFLNIDIRNFENKLIKDVEESTLPVEVKRLVVRDLLNQLEIASAEVMRLEIKGDSNGIYKDNLE